VAAAVAVLALTLSGPAAAQYTLPPDNSGADQYVPPTAGPGGNTPSSPGPGHPGSLPPGVRASLPPGSEGKLLTRIATDPGSGAPVGVSGRTGAAGRHASSRNGSATGSSSADSGATGKGRASVGVAHEAGTNAASAITNAVSDNTGVGILAAGLFALTLGAAGLGLAQRRRRSY
jgi:hypothetical protein